MIKDFYFRQEKNVNNVCVRIKNTNVNIPMIYEGGIFRASLQLQEGRYIYKYIVNNTIRFNDPDAENYVMDAKGEVWSECVVRDGIEICKYTDFGKVKTYILSNRKFEDNLLPKKIFYFPTDTQICLNVEICLKKGIHSITEVWHRADGILYAVKEHPIPMENDGIGRIGFGIFLHKNKIRLGIWRVDVYVDGEKVISEYFSVTFRHIVSQNFINVQI